MGHYDQCYEAEADERIAEKKKRYAKLSKRFDKAFAELEDALKEVDYSDRESKTVLQASVKLEETQYWIGRVLKE